MPKILPQLLGNRLLEPNPIKILKEGSLRERAEEGLGLLRNGQTNGQKILVMVSDK